MRVISFSAYKATRQITPINDHVAVFQTGDKVRFKASCMEGVIVRAQEWNGVTVYHIVYTAKELAGTRVAVRASAIEPIDQGR